MSRKKIVRKTIALPRKMAKALEDLFESYDMSFSEGIRMIIARFISDLIETNIEKTLIEAKTLGKKIQETISPSAQQPL
ncbi:MAG: hypothetical protein Q6363_008065 [Candidatus Njordarchaeota archaeon]